MKALLHAAKTVLATYGRATRDEQTLPNDTAGAATVARALADKHGHIVLFGDDITTLADALTGATSVVTAGAYVATLTFTNTTGVTFPTSGTLATRAGSETLTNKTISTGVLTSCTVTTGLLPTTDDGAALGATSYNFSDLFLATGAVINYANGNVALTHTSGILTLGTGELRITTVGTNAASVPTLGSTSTLTNKTLTSAVLGTGLTASGIAANDFSGSTGTFLTSSGANTISGTATVAANKNLLCASGTSLLDFSLGTGIFKSPSGLNTLGGKVAFKVVATPVAAAGAGSGVSGAAALGSANIVTVSSDGATKGVKLLTGVAGDIVHVLNTSSTACNLFAASGGTINGGSADAGCAIPASKGVKAICTAADTWTVFDLAAHAGAAA